ncbi:hypothetical protein EDD11_001098 [Mortierella claussenii]|nr:hypothetical protein EDD11_001098 [Mortierella claussenii]
MSNSSSCTSSPFSSPETGAELDILELPMFLPIEPLSYQRLDIDSSNELLASQQYQAYASVQQQKQYSQQQQFQYNMAQIGLGTPPTSPPAPAFHKYPGNGSEMGTLYYDSQPQVIQNVYVAPTQPVLQLQQHPQKHNQHISQQQQEEDMAYRLLLQQFDNLESSLFSPSSISSSCSSSLSSSPYGESPLMAIGSDFDLFPMHSATGVQQATVGYPSAPVMAPPATAQSVYAPSSVYPQLTPPMNQTDLEREVCSLFKHDAINADLANEQPLTTELSMLCKCPGKFPCGEQLPVDAIDSVSPLSSPLQDIREIEYTESELSSEEEEQMQEEDEEVEQEYDPTYVAVHQRSNKSGRPKSMVISTSSAPYSSPFSKDPSTSPKSPVRHDRRRSSSGSFSSFGGHSHNQQLLDPEMIPEIKDIHVCPVCDRRFTRPFNLRSHLMTHTTARPFPCDECHWKFTRQHDLLRHKRAKHPNSVINNTPSTAGQKKDSVAKSRPVSAA